LAILNHGSTYISAVARGVLIGAEAPTRKIYGGAEHPYEMGKIGKKVKGEPFLVTNFSLRGYFWLKIFAARLFLA
jgi:hypothetical protein